MKYQINEEVYYLVYDHYSKSVSIYKGVITEIKDNQYILDKCYIVEEKYIKKEVHNLIHNIEIVFKEWGY